MDAPPRQERITLARAAVAHWGWILISFGKALAQHPETEFTRDSAVRRFELSFDLACRAIAQIAFVDLDRIDAGYLAPIKYAVKRGWISDYMKRWHRIVVDRHDTQEADEWWTTENFMDKMVVHYNPMVELHAALQKVVEVLAPPPTRVEGRRERTGVDWKLHDRPMRRGYVRFMRQTHPVRWNRISKQTYVRVIWEKTAARIGQAETMQDALDLALEWLSENKQPRPVESEKSEKFFESSPEARLQFGIKHRLLVDQDGKIAPTDRFLSRFSREIGNALRQAERGECIAADIWGLALYETTAALTSPYTDDADVLRFIAGGLESLGLYFVEFGLLANCLVGTATDFHMEETLRADILEASTPFFDDDPKQDVGLILLREGIKLIDMRLTAYCPDMSHYRDALSLTLLKICGLDRFFDPDLLLPDED